MIGKNGTRWTTISIITSTNNFESTNHFMLFTQTIFLISSVHTDIIMYVCMYIFLNMNNNMLVSDNSIMLLT